MCHTFITDTLLCYLRCTRFDGFVEKQKKLWPILIHYRRKLFAVISIIKPLLYNLTITATITAVWSENLLHCTTNDTR